jgi:hypothetical protein
MSRSSFARFAVPALPARVQASAIISAASVPGLIIGWGAAAS